MISDKEKVCVSDEALRHLIEISEGDLRRSITLLQSAHRYASALQAGDDEVMHTDQTGVQAFIIIMTDASNDVSVEMINDLAGIIPDTAVEQFFASVKTGSFDKLERAVIVR